MKMKNNFIKPLALGLICVTLGFVSCKKDDGGNSSCPPSKTSMITNKKWVVTEMTIAPGIVVDSATGETTTNYYQFLDSCGYDEFFELFETGTGIFDIGSNSCDSIEPQVSRLNWKFINKGTQLEILVEGDTESNISDIKKLTSNILILEKNMGVMFDDNINRTITITHEPMK